MLSLSQITHNFACGLLLLGVLFLENSSPAAGHAIKTPRANAVAATGRERTSLNAGWRFSRFTSNPDSLSYDKMKSWILPSANNFITGTARTRPSGSAPNATYVTDGFNDGSWEQVDLPHDWAVRGPFGAPGIGGGMGRLPSNGVGWYRRKVAVSDDDIKAGKSLFLDVDGAMSYAAVWLNGNFVGGWPYGYNSFRLDLTPYAKAGDNLLAIRLDNALDSSRWYPGAGIYRNVWLVKVDPTHVGQYGTYITTPSVSSGSATVSLAVQVENKRTASQAVDVVTEIYQFDPSTGKAKGDVVATFPKSTITVAANSKQTTNGTTTVKNPLLWGPAPAQKPNLYVAITTISANGAAIDVYETQFGIRSVTYDPNKGLLINNQQVRVQGVCNHHDLGSLGAAFNTRALERQLDMLQEMGSNALRTSHNPPAPELLELADRKGFMVLDEIFDCWSASKTSNDFHLIFADWREPDLRSFIRRDRNHPSVVAWSVGNEIPEQSSSAGGTIGQALKDIAHSEDPSRGITSAMNSASPGSALADVVDIIGLNYQGEGMGGAPSGSFGNFHSKYPKKMIWTTESSSVLSSRGTYVFPVTSANSATVGSGAGENSSALQVSAYELYAPSWGSSPDKVFAAQDKSAFVAGEFVWTGFDYIGEPTPYDSARSSYFGIIDMAGFKKDRFYLYQARWRSSLPMAHILPHWTWPDRVGQVTPVHVFSAADEVELFLNGKSQGRLKRAASTWRFRWDSVKYEAGTLHAVAYVNGSQWAEDTKKTVGDAAALTLVVDRSSIAADGKDLVFVSVAVVDKNGDTVPRAGDAVSFKVEGPGKIVATDNGNPADMTAFPSTTRNAFSGLALAIVRADVGASGTVTVEASAKGLTGAKVVVSVG